jgi:GNAT superfamily N-acetyltransferase
VAVEALDGGVQQAGVHGLAVAHDQRGDGAEAVLVFVEDPGRCGGLGEVCFDGRDGCAFAASLAITALSLTDVDSTSDLPLAGQRTQPGIGRAAGGYLVHTVAMIRTGTLADLPAARDVFRRASLANEGNRDNLLAHPEYLILGPDGLAEDRTYVAEEGGSVVGFATWVETDGTIELEDLFVEPDWMRQGIATALVHRIADVLRARGVERMEVTANPDALEFYRSVGFVECGVAETELGPAPRMVLAVG